MADEIKSQFLPFQDRNGDMFPDPQYPGDPNGCPEIEPAPDICLPCSPNPLASVPDWKKRKNRDAFLNEKLCQWQVVMHTQEIEVINIDDYWSKYGIEYTDKRQYPKNGAVRKILQINNKDQSSGSLDIATQALEHTDYWLDPRPRSYLKLLYSIDFDVINDLPDAEEEEEEGEEPGDITVKYDAHDMLIWNIRVRKGLNLYNRYYKVFRAMEGANLVYTDSGRVLDLERYGDLAMGFSSSAMYDVMNQLDAWLNGRGLNIANTGTVQLFTAKSKVVELEMVFDAEYNIKKLKVWTEDCAELPITYNKSDLQSLHALSAWKDKTAVAYFAKLEEFQNDLSAREEQPWQEVLKKHTYPPIHSTAVGNADVEGDETIGGCIADALENEMKALGQDIMDDVFSIGDAVAYAFHKNLCRHDPTEVSADNNSVGKNDGTPEVDGNTNMWSAAIMQAYKEVDPRDQIFAHFCIRMLTFNTGGSPLQALDDMWATGFERLKICGLLDLLTQVMDCLLGGLTLEEAIRKMLQSALKAMAWDDFGELFVGLPPAKQEELNQMVQKNLQNGVISSRLVGQGEGNYDTEQEYESSNQELVEGNKEPFFGGYGIQKPWENEKLVAAQKETMRNNNGTMVPTKAPGFGDQDPTVVRRSLSEKALLSDQARATGALDPQLILDAYILALLDIFQDDYLFLLDQLNKFPGAQIVSILIATVECPRPPLFNPGLPEFIKSLGFPWCRGKNEIVMPRFENPFMYIPTLKDIWQAIKKLLKKLIIELVIKIIVLVLVKICTLIGDAICKALEVTGDLIGSLPAMATGRQKFSDVIKDSICGDDADEKEVNDTVTQIMSDLGPGGQALANPDRARSFMEDISAAITQAELLEALSGNTPIAMQDIIEQIVDNEYPEYSDAFPSGAAIGDFFKNVGNLMPANIRSDMKDALRAIDPGAETPVNPTLCATPEKLEDFKNLRCQLLEGRASPEQCDEMFDKWRGTMLDDLGEVADIINKGIGPTVADQLPPIFSDPGCDNGMLPRETEEMVATATSVLKKDMEKLKVAYSTDMLDNGPWMKRWGLINMIMSDTLGRPFSTHQRLTFNNKEDVDFYVRPSLTMDSAGADALGRKFAPLPRQEGAYPIYVSEYLMYQFQNAGSEHESPEVGGASFSAVKDLQNSMEFDSNNNSQDYKFYSIKFDRLDISATNLSITSIPNPGYNTDTIPNIQTERVQFIRNPRKKYETPDVELKFRDNAKGMNRGPNGGQSPFAYGFNLKCYFSDLYEFNPDDESNAMAITYAGQTAAPSLKTAGEDSVTDTEGVPVVQSPTRTPPAIIANRPTDNVRIYIQDLFNQDSLAADHNNALAPEDDDDREKKRKSETDYGILRDRKFEFLAVDDGLEPLRAEDGRLNLSQYPNLAQSFERKTSGAPQVLALYDMLSQEIPYGTLKRVYDDFMGSQFKSVAAAIGHNKKAWEYGAKFDTLSFNDFQYVVPRGTSLQSGAPGMPMSDNDVTVPDYNSRGERLPDGRPINNEDMILGVSLNQFNVGEGDSRVIYLDPGKYGGTYMNPPMYVRPLTGSGWMGIVDVMFPEISPCKPASTEVVDFGEIQDKIDQMYPQIPDDSRLKGDPDCVVEVPYNRILDRPAKAGLMGVILSTIRIFVGTHFLKTIATFSKFAPTFPTNYSNVYAAYIIERMEETLKDAGSNFLNPFKDDEFWYAFLEQSVQLYAYRIRNGDIPGVPRNGEPVEVPSDVEAALQRLDDLQEDYDYPYRDDLNEAIAQGKASFIDTIKNYREEKNLEAVFHSADDAKVVLKELVLEQLREIGQKFTDNLSAAGLQPDVYDLDYYFLNTFAKGANFNLDFNPKSSKLVEFPVGLPTKESPDPAGQDWVWPGPFYSNGNEFTTVSDDTYVGYYHAMIDSADGALLYFMGDAAEMTGSDGNPPSISVDDLDIEQKGMLLRPFAEKVMLGISSSSGIVGIGDIDPTQTHSTDDTTSEQPFVLEKYIKVNGVKMIPDAAVAAVGRLPGGLISEHYPGTMRLVYDEEDKPVGVEGELGVRYGLQLKMDVLGNSKTLTEVEINALDTPVTAFTGIESDSKLLWCLIGKLKEDGKFRLLVDYIFSLKKVLGIMAIYNDMAFLPSIGEWTVTDKDLNGGVGTFIWDSPANAWPTAAYEGSKPGTYANITLGSEVGEVMEIDGEEFDFIHSVNLIPGARGWAAINSRAGRSPFFVDYDQWDQQLLRNSARILKKMFRVYYRSREWGKEDSDSGALQWLQQLRERFKISPGAQFLPWWKKNRLRPNPYNKDGELCDKKD